jgi:3-methyl-2-oxobutanoate hydroxymethyltransferase
MFSSYSPATKMFLKRLPRISSRLVGRFEPDASCSLPSAKCRRTFASKTSALSLNAKKRKGKKITMVTAYDYPSAAHVARAGIDMILVGDSVAMVELGYETTQNVSIDSMIHHCQSVKRGLKLAGSGSMLVGDMPFGTYEYDNTDIALQNAYRFVKEAGCDAVKLEVCNSET